MAPNRSSATIPNPKSTKSTDTTTKQRTSSRSKKRTKKVPITAGAQTVASGSGSSKAKKPVTRRQSDRLMKQGDDISKAKKDKGESGSEEEVNEDGEGRRNDLDEEMAGSDNDEESMNGSEEKDKESDGSDDPIPLDTCNKRKRDITNGKSIAAEDEGAGPSQKRIKTAEGKVKIDNTKKVEKDKKEKKNRSVKEKQTKKKPVSSKKKGAADADGEMMGSTNSEDPEVSGDKRKPQEDAANTEKDEKEERVADLGPRRTTRYNTDALPRQFNPKLLDWLQVKAIPVEAEKSPIVEVPMDTPAVSVHRLKLQLSACHLLSYRSLEILINRPTTSVQMEDFLTALKKKIELAGEAVGYFGGAKDQGIMARRRELKLSRSPVADLVEVLMWTCRLVDRRCVGDRLPLDFERRGLEKLLCKIEVMISRLEEKRM